MDRFGVGVLLTLLLSLAMPAAAQDVPPALQDWQGWVLHDQPRHGCPFLAGSMPTDASRRCVWPGKLSLRVDAHGAHFQVRVELDAEDWLPLPGDSHHWPEQVTVDGKPVVVHDQDGVPALRLAAGRYTVAGQWSWTSLPNHLAMPDLYGLIALELDGKAAASLERSGGQLILTRGTAVAVEADAASARVFRKLHDGLPPTLETRLELDISGRARELVLGPVLPAGFVATQLDAPLPARLDRNGTLRLQVRPGNWPVTLTARGTSPLAAVEVGPAPAPWPQAEVWSYADTPELRHTRVEGSALDPAQAGVPGNWRRLPAFAVRAGQGLSVVESARVGEGRQSERVHVQRTMWLDFDGRNFTVSDRLAGTLDHPVQLVVTPPWQLQRASSQDVPLLVGELAGGARGIEASDSNLNIDTGLILPRSALAGMPLTGWDLALESLRLDLRLPPGWRLVAAPGASQSQDSWMDAWQLPDIFLVALIALLCGRLLGWPIGLAAALYLILAHGESHAPYLTVLLAAGLGLLVRGLSPGRLRRAAYAATLAFAMLAGVWALPFAATQLRNAVYPQLTVAVSPIRSTPRLVQRAEPPLAPRVADVSEEYGAMALPAPPPPAPAAPPPKVISDGITVSASVRQPPRDLADQGPVQSGPGIPDWDLGATYRLQWSGPVTPGQAMHLVIAPAWLVRLLRVLAVAGLVLLLLRLWRQLLPAGWRRAGIGSAGAALIVGMLAGFAPSTTAQAVDLPSPEMLQQLQQRLLQPPPCAPDCALLADARVTLENDRLVLLLQAQAEAAVAIPVPRWDEALTLVDVTIDGNPSGVLRDGVQPVVRLERGVHSLRLAWRIGGDHAQISFDRLQPKRVRVLADGWVVAGVNEDALSGDTLAFSRQQPADGAATTATGVTAQTFPPYVRVERRVLLGSDWRVFNTVQRLAPDHAGFSVSVPLLQGEYPLDDGVRVRDGQVILDFKAGEQWVSWNSRIEPFTTLELSAPSLADRAETWQLQAAPTWHVDAEGVPPQPADGLLSWAPLPGETLRLEASRVVPAPGAEVAFDNASLRVRLGGHSRDLELGLTARSTRGGEHTISLPEDTRMLDARRDGEVLTLPIRDGHTGLPLRPGSNNYALDMQRTASLGIAARTPVVDLKAPVANIQLQLELPASRWIIWTWGPRVGPAVLYWPMLLMLALVAWLLTRFAPAPLRFHHWLLLGMGLLSATWATAAWCGYAVIAGWLVVFGLRGRLHNQAVWSRWRFNLMQLGLALFTLIVVILLFAAVANSLLGHPDMQIAGNHLEGRLPGGATLGWLVDRSDGPLPQAGVLSLPLWCYRLAILLWALWLANALIGWLRWVFRAWSHGGYWKKKAVVPEPQEAPAADA